MQYPGVVLKETNRGYAVALRLVRATFKGLDPETVALRAGVPYDGCRNEFTVDLFGQSYKVSWPEAGIKNGDHEPADDVSSILILHYLRDASGVPARNRWISIKELPGGAVYQEAFKRRTLIPLSRIVEKGMGFLSLDGTKKNDDLARTWLTNVKRQVGESGSGVWSLGDIGDISFFVRALPRIPLGFVYWAGCVEEGIPSSGTVLFDESAPAYLPTEDLIVLADLGVSILRRAISTQET
ncbi:MAG TPA: DUF3786 domain-containing protein [Clostridia bacterium]|nr:DUF3786 domain-containing protein [Clostridia bacterium]